MKAVIFPGQGAQYKGMGKELFKTYRRQTDMASEILGYDLEQLCVEDPQRQLGKTEFTQPALYVVNALGYYGRQEDEHAFFAGHSLGEYNALLAAGAFDFETGLRLVKKRGELMSSASGGAMAAVLGISLDSLRQLLREGDYASIDIANFNTPTQTVISGPQESINRIVKDLDGRKIKIVPLYVSAPFHSRYMRPAAEEFADFLKNFTFYPLKGSVVANTTGLPYEAGQTARLLSEQIANPVHWTDSIRWLLNKGVTTYEEIGSGTLTKMVNEIRTAHVQVATCDIPPAGADPTAAVKRDVREELGSSLGSRAFREEYGVKYAYMAGAMYRGIGSKELVICMAKAGLLGFLGTGGMSLEDIRENIRHIQATLTRGEPYGMNLLHNMVDPPFERRTVELYLRMQIRNIEAAAYMQITPPLAYYRIKGLTRGEDGGIRCAHRIVAKVSRPEVAEAFMRPAPDKIVHKLLEEGLITAEEAALARSVPMSHDICVEADSGGHTDGGVALVLLPSIQRLREDIMSEYHYARPVRVGLAGGLGTPQAVACAFLMGADFVLTGSINQCTVEAGTSEEVKEMLQDINVQDTAYAPAGDMFEIGAKVQVLKKGVLFPARANKLYTLYTQYSALEEIPDKLIVQLEHSYFRKPVHEVWKETKTYFEGKGEHAQIERAMQQPKMRMALIFRWYFAYSARLAFAGDTSDRVNFQVHTGPALGAFNQWVKGTPWANWRNRHADKIGIRIMGEAAKLLKDTLSRIN